MSDPVTRSIMVKGDVSRLFALWANFENFPSFMQHIKSVTRTNESLSHWVMEGPLKQTFEWDAEITRMDLNKRIAWRSLDGSEMKTSGQVTFNPLPDKQVQITVTLHYIPPKGKLGEIFAGMLADPEAYLDEDLRHFKEYAEQTAAV
jgi:uncharacterized membrane protein